MTRSSLAEILAKRDRKQIALVTPRSEHSVGMLLDTAQDLRFDWSRQSSSAVAFGGDVVGFVIALIAFDGAVSDIMIQPVSGDASLTEAERRHCPGDYAYTRWLIPTSGTTTGMPTTVAHTLETLTRSTKLDSLRGASHRWGLLYDPARFAGLQVVLQALLGGGVLVAPDDRGDLPAAVDFFTQKAVSAISATPTMWRRLLMTPGITELALRQITLGGEIADASVLTAVRSTFPSARVVHIYASTEAGVGFAVRDGLPGFPASYLGPGALPGVELAIGENGHLLVKSESLNNQQLSAAGFFDTGDIVRLESGRVFFVGRASGAINVGGNKVSPEVVETVLMAHPEVAIARAYAKESSQMGSLVAADIALSDGSDPVRVRSEIIKLCRERLPQWQRPVSLRFVATIEVNSAGKVVRSRNQVEL